MLEKLGVVTNCWAKAMKEGARFEDLMVRFAEEGFRRQEIRDGEYLRQSPFGRLIEAVEGAMSHYDDGTWKTICGKVPSGEGLTSLVNKEDLGLLDQLRAFAQASKGLILSYAFTCPWLTGPEDVDADNARVRRAIKLATLFSPDRARLRLVALDPVEEVLSEIALSNLRRYRSLLPDYPMTYALENSRQPAALTLQLAREGGFLLTYDEANLYRGGGVILDDPETFWSAVKRTDLASIHLKQKDRKGLLPRLGKGLVDFPVLFRHLRAIGYTGDILLENRPTEDPLEDALQSRVFIRLHWKAA